MNGRILLAEDDRTLRETLSEALSDEGYDVTSVSTGFRAGELAFDRHFQLVILDWMLPGRSGVDVLAELRREGIGTPVLLLTVRSDENDKVTGFEVGADDYVTKPFSLRELLARVKALIRRSELKSAPTNGASRVGSFRLGNQLVDLRSFRITGPRGEASLSKKEAEILSLLQLADGAVVSRSTFLHELWGADAAVTDRTIDTHILHLRKKIEARGGRPQFLLTVHGVGYRLVCTSAGASQE
ncbi:MAG: response regulator transcription factor [Planctomycetota bacterium]